MEHFTLKKIAEAAAEKGFRKITAEYIPTTKNGLVKDHYSNLGFTSKGDLWELDLSCFAPQQTFINEQLITA